MVSFGHGFLQAVSQYHSTLDHLATWGFIVIATESQGGFSPSHGEYGRDLSDCLTYMVDQNEVAGSRFFGVVDTGALGLSGHSMGGGAGILSAASDGRVRVLANMAAAETSPSAVAASESISCPVFLISGSQDTITPPGSHGQPMYGALPGSRQLPMITGGFHCGFTDAGFLFCDSGSITRAEQPAITRRMLTRVFTLHLKEDVSVWRDVWGPEALATAGVVTSSDARVGVQARRRGRGRLARWTLRSGCRTSVHRRWRVCGSRDGARGVALPGGPVVLGPIEPGGQAGATVRAAAPRAFGIGGCGAGARRRRIWSAALRSLG